jgi:cytochrome c peroxidase
MIYKLIFGILAISLFLTSTTASEDIKKWLRPSEVPQPADNRLTPQRVKLGKLLYFDKRLSSSEKISCATCHHPKHGWSDEHPTPKAVGHDGLVGPRNSPTILNSAYQSRQFWDGRARTLEEQALGPIQAGVEMHMPLDVLIPKLNKIEGYQKLFKEAYPKSGGIITSEYLAKAIASFERTVVSTESPFDKYIKGDKKAISKNAKEGFELFKGKAKCTDCHDGFNFTDGSFHNIGLNDGELHGKELGRYLVKKRASWYGVMKTPTLRDVAKSYPYFHDGSVKTLKEATVICASGGRYENNVKNKSTYMKNRHLSEDEVDKIIVFMKSLTGPDMKLKIPTKFPQ